MADNKGTGGLNFISKSSFNPQIISNTGVGIGANIRIIDPNPIGEIVPHEDLNIFVSLVAKQRSKSVITEENNEIKVTNDVKNTINLASPQESVDGTKLFRSKPNLTTDWTEIGGFKSGSLGKDYESFGITNIDINIESVTTPKVSIDFVDVRGATLFEQGSCSPYGLFFNLPYPIFELTVKGYYGKPVKYYLNLVKFNARFNSDTGNMECKAEFIGWSFAFLSDMIVGYIGASQLLPEGTYGTKQSLRNAYENTWKFYTDNKLVTGGNPFCDNPAVSPNRCVNILDILKALDRLNETSLPEVKGSDEFLELSNILSFQSKYENYKESIDKLIKDELITKLGLTPKGSTQTGQPRVRFEFKTRAEVDAANVVLGKYFNKSGKDIGSLIGLIKGIKTQEITPGNYGLEGINVQTSLTKTDFDVETNINRVYSDLDSTAWQRGVLLGYKESTEVQTDPSTGNEIFYIDFGYILSKINGDEETIKGIIKNKRETAVDGINTIIESQFGFKPTIRNIFTVLLCNTEAFISTLLEVATKAERYHKDNKDSYKQEINKQGPGEKITSNDGAVYAWPTYYETNHYPSKGVGKDQGTKEVYPGVSSKSVIKNWVEVRFVEDFIDAFLKFEKEIEILNNNTEGKVGYDNYAPITTLEAPISHENKMIYADLTDTSLEGISKTIGERLFISLDHTNFQPQRYTGTVLPTQESKGKWNPFVDSKTDLPTILGKIDGWNLLNSKDGSAGKLFLQVLKDSFKDLENFKTSIKNELGKSGTLTEANSIIKYTPNDAFITLTAPDVDTTVHIYPDPFLMIEDGGVDNLMKIITDGATFNKIEITNTDFKTVLEDYKSKLTTYFPTIVNFSDSDFKIENNLVLDETQQILEFKTKNIFINLACQDANQKGDWWDTGNLNAIKPYWLTYFTAIDTTRVNEAYPVSLKAQSDYNFSSNQTTIWGTEIKQEDTIEFKNVTGGTNIYFRGSIFGSTSDASEVEERGGIIDSFVTTPIWNDNINSFRQLAGALPLKLDSSGNEETTQNRNLAYLFLHLLKPSPLIIRGLSNTGVGAYDLKDSTEFWTIKNFNITGGVIKVPKAWVLAFGSELWRWKEFVGTTVINGSTVWRRPFLPTQLPTGFDPLAQPGFNCYNPTKSVRNDGEKVVDSKRNDFNVYLTRIYGNTTGGWASKIQTSAFGNNYENSISTSNENFGMDINDDIKISFDYYGVYKDDIANNDKTNYGTWNGNVPVNNLIQNVRAASATLNYSWPSLWISPHHIPYTHPVVFDSNNTIVDAPETYIQLFKNSIGTTDYQSMWTASNDGSKTITEYFEDFEKKRIRRSNSFDGGLGLVMENIPDEVKDLFVKTFTDWCDAEWKTDILPTIDPIHFGKSKMENTYKLYTRVDDKDKKFLDEFASAAFLLRENNQSVVDKMFAEWTIVNSTPKIWYGIQSGPLVGNNPFGDSFQANTESYNKYLDEYHKVITGPDNDKRVSELEKTTSDAESPLNDTSLDDTDVKLSLYRSFKSLTDKWISSSSSGKLFFNILEDGLGDNSKCRGINKNDKPTLASHFQYVNRTMGDIGNEVVIDATKLNELKTNKKISLYQYIADVLTDNEYMFFPLPAYVNFSAKGLNATDLEDMFRPVMDMESISCGPLFLSMYVGGNSRQLNYAMDTKCEADHIKVNFEDDGFSLTTGGGRPSEFDGTVLANENGNDDVGFVAFKVVYGLDTQNHFKNIQLDQSEFSETAESLLVIDKLSQQGGTDQSTKGQNLNSVYLTRSYTCQIESLGNMMIQPMTYFDLLGVPMFNGAYLITKVSHNIKPNHATTTFKGVRQPRTTIPLVTDAAVAMNLSLKNVEAKKGSKLGQIVTNARGGRVDPNLYPDISEDILKLFDNPVYCVNKPVVTSQVYRSSGELHSGLDIGFSSPDESWVAGTEEFNRSKSNGKSAKIKSAYNGVVTNIGQAEGFGSPPNGGWIIVRYGENGGEDPFSDGFYYFYVYGHSVANSNITLNSKVTTGQELGKSVWPNKTSNGTNVRNTGLHLHLQVHRLTTKNWSRDGKIDGSRFLNKKENCIGNVNSAIPSFDVGYGSNVPQSTKISDTEKTTNQVKVKNFLKSKGLTEIQVAGIMGNIQKESLFNPGAVNAKDLNGYSSYGLIQWNQQYVKVEDVGNTVESQLEYLVNPKTPYGKTLWNRFLKDSSVAKDADISAWNFANHVEVCDKCNKGYEIYKMNYPYERSKFALDFIKRFKDSNDPLYWG